MKPNNDEAPFLAKLSDETPNSPYETLVNDDSEELNEATEPIQATEPSTQDDAETLLAAQTSHQRKITAKHLQLIHEIADKLAEDNASGADVKLLAFALRELRHSLRVFAPYRGVRKVTIFGSARTPPQHPAYQAAVAFAQQMQAAGYMVITGAGGGIMEAGHLGAGRDASFGLNIQLPFEQSANPIIDSDPKLINMRYFFTRKLMFIKESDAVVLFPGGFGTHDEAFEALTLIQTGKSHLFPVVMVDEPGGTYWQRFQNFLEDDLLARGYISPADLSLYRITDSVSEAVAEVMNFYRVFHSLRYVRKQLVIRLHQTLHPRTLATLRSEFQDVLLSGDFELRDALKEEANEPQIAHLPRLVFTFDRVHQGRLRQLIDVLNQAPEAGR